MNQITKKEDYVGKWKISQNAYSQLPYFLPQFQERYLVDLLGVELYKLFAADFDADPSLENPVYAILYEPILEDNTSGFGNVFYPVNGGWFELDGYCQTRQIRSEGIKNMMLGFMYWEFMRRDWAKSTPTGLVKPQPENSESVRLDDSGLYIIYNEAIASFNAIQAYILKHKEEYPLFNGIRKGVAHWAL